MDIRTGFKMAGIELLLNTVVRESIARLRTFYAEAEGQYRSGLDKLKDDEREALQKQLDELSPDDRNLHLYENDVDNYYADAAVRLNELAELQEHLCIVGLFTAFEWFLRETLQTLSSSDPALSKCIHRMRLDKMKKGFSSLGVSITTPDGDWQEIMRLKEVRNCITHSGGYPDAEKAKKLRNYGITVVESKMVLAEGYFEESACLIERTCERITKACRNALTERRKNTN